MQEEIKEKLPKNVHSVERDTSFYVVIQENKKKYRSKHNQNLTIALYFADVMIKKNGLRRKLFLTEQEFNSCYLDNIVYFTTEDYFNQVETIKKEEVYYINRICRVCNSEHLVNKVEYRCTTFKKKYPDTEYYKCKRCATSENIEAGVPKTEEDFVELRKLTLKKRRSNTSGYAGIMLYTKNGQNMGWFFQCRNHGFLKSFYLLNGTIEEIVWLRDDYIRHMGFDNVLNLTDEVYFAQEFKYKFNKKIDWRKAS